MPYEGSNPSLPMRNFMYGLTDKKNADDNPPEENKEVNEKKQDTFLMISVLLFAIGWWFLRKLSGY